MKILVTMNDTIIKAYELHRANNINGEKDIFLFIVEEYLFGKPLYIDYDTTTTNKDFLSFINATWNTYKQADHMATKHDFLDEVKTIVGNYKPRHHYEDMLGRKFENLKCLCDGLGISSRAARGKIKSGEIKKVINKIKVNLYGNYASN